MQPRRHSNRSEAPAISYYKDHADLTAESNLYLNKSKAHANPNQIRVPARVPTRSRPWLKLRYRGATMVKTFQLSGVGKMPSAKAQVRYA